MILRCLVGKTVSFLLNSVWLSLARWSLAALKWKYMVITLIPEGVLVPEYVNLMNLS